MIIVENEKDFKFYAEVQALKTSLGGYADDIIRAYVIRNIEIEDAERAWYNNKITCSEFNFIKENSN